MDKDMEETGYVLFCGVDGKGVTQFGLTKLSITTHYSVRGRWCALPLSNGLRASPPPIVHWVTGDGAMLHSARCLSREVGSDWQLSVNAILYA